MQNITSQNPASKGAVPNRIPPKYKRLQVKVSIVLDKETWETFRKKISYKKGSVSGTIELLLKKYVEE